MARIAVVGAGAVGLSVALHAAEAGHAVTVLEKEARPGLHQSGRNSGVIHPGFNAKPGTAKARYCVEGARRMKAFCREEGVAVVEGGILVVATVEAERGTLRELHARASGNGVEARLLDAGGLREVEPHAVGLEALHAPTGASVDAPGFVAALERRAKAAGAEIRYGSPVRALSEDESGVALRTPTDRVEAEVAVNCAGLHADRLAGAVAADLRVVPFRGYYASLAPEAARLVRSHLYQAPDLRHPFLGVHLSRRTDGQVLAGPGAMLAFGREAYRFAGVDARDLAATLGWPGFWRLLPRIAAHLPGEVRRSLSLHAMARQARALVPALRPEHLRWAQAGNRAQMVDRQGRLADDILVRETDHAVHVLNAVSPGLTCSLPFGEDVARRAVAKA